MRGLHRIIDDEFAKRFREFIEAESAILDAGIVLNNNISMSNIMLNDDERYYRSTLDSLERLEPKS